MPTRNSSIDIAKGLGIILVVAGHNWTISHQEPELFRIIFSFHMPLFFLLSGIFLKGNQPFIAFLITKADSLLKPYFAVQIIWAMKAGLVTLLTASALSIDLHQVYGIAYGSSKALEWVPMWFLPHLFMASITAMALIRAADATPQSRLILWLSVCLALPMGTRLISLFWWPDASLHLNHAFPGLPWSGDLLLITTSFMLVGYLLKKRILNFRFHTLWTAAAICLFAASHYFFDETIDLNARLYGSFLICTLQAASGIYICISLASLLGRFAYPRRCLSYVGSATLFILMFHSYFQDKAFLLLAQVELPTTFELLICISAGVCLPIVLWEIAKKQNFISGILLPRKYQFMSSLQGKPTSDVAPASYEKRHEA